MVLGLVMFPLAQVSNYIFILCKCKNIGDKEEAINITIIIIIIPQNFIRFISKFL
jgi:hypothetical protein